MHPHLKGCAEKISECKMNYRAGEQVRFLCNQFTEAANTMPKMLWKCVKAGWGWERESREKQIANK